jgi:hypothetical protein
MSSDNAASAARIQQRIDGLARDQAAARQAVEALSQKAREAQFKADAYRQLASEARSIASGVRSHAGGAGPAGEVTHAFHGSVIGVREMRGLAHGTWTGAAADAFQTQAATFSDTLKAPQATLHTWYLACVKECEQLAHQAEAKSASQAAIAMAARRDAGRAQNRIASLGGQLRGARADLADLKAKP